MHKRRLAAALALPVLAMLLVLAGCEEEDTIFDWVESSSAQASVSETVELTFDAPSQLSLDCSTYDGAVAVHGSPDLQTVSVTVTRTARAQTEDEANDRLQRMRYTATLDDRTLLLEYDNDDQDADLHDRCGVAFHVRVPSDTSVFISTSNGAITIADVTGDALAVTSNGRIEAVRIRGDLEADTSNGTLQIEDVSGDILAQTSNGSIAFSGRPANAANVSLRTSNGRITVRVPSDASVAFSARTSNARIETDLDLVGDTSGDNWDCALNPPATATLRLRTSNGPIHLMRLP